mmetsp:Transcript_31576/g.102923  ORF Transcript_31576/g.102923 Transcript_31576/m.102923 type:complete len:174 (+) Transcript_31576:3-524(+)
MRSSSAVLFVVLALCLQPSAGLQWKKCMLSPPIHPRNLTLTPEPAKVGQPLTLVVEARAHVPLASGICHVNISFAGAPIWTTHVDLCSMTTCPIKAGPLTLTYQESLPKVLPPGTYGIILEVEDTAKPPTIYSCVDVVLPIILGEEEGGHGEVGFAEGDEDERGRRAPRPLLA